MPLQLRIGRVGLGRGRHVVVDVGQGVGGLRRLTERGVGLAYGKLDIGARGDAVFLKKLGGLGGSA